MSTNDIAIGYGGGYIMTHRQDILESFEKGFRKKGILMVLISQSFPNTEEEPVRKGLLLTGSYTANVYRELRGVYGDIRVRGFQIYRDCI